MMSLSLVKILSSTDAHKIFSSSSGRAICEAKASGTSQAVDISVCEETPISVSIVEDIIIISDVTCLLSQGGSCRLFSGSHSVTLG